MDETEFDIGELGELSRMANLCVSDSLKSLFELYEDSYNHILNYPNFYATKVAKPEQGFFYGGDVYLSENDDIFVGADVFGTAVLHYSCCVTYMKQINFRYACPINEELTVLPFVTMLNIESVESFSEDQIKHLGLARANFSSFEFVVCE